MKAHAILFFLTLATLGAAPASASYSESAAGLQCRGNTVAVRFGRADNGGPPSFDPLPLKYDAAWSEVAYSTDKRCTLANGTKVELHDGRGLAFAWGAGGANPDGFFSLWIGGRKVVSREKYYHGYGSSNPRTNSLFLAGNLIERCRYTTENFESASPDQIVCASEPIDISALPIDPLLPSIDEQSLVGRYSVATNYSPTFCKSLIAEFSDGGVTREFLEVPREAQRFFQPAGADRDTPSASVDQFDLGNSGRMDTVIQFSGEEKLFYGSVHFYRRGKVPESEIRTLLDQRRQFTSGDYVERARELGWSTIVDAPDLRTRWTLFRLSGTTFLLEQASFGSDATLYRTVTYGPQFAPSPEPVCVYRMMQEPF